MREVGWAVVEVLPGVSARRTAVVGALVPGAGGGGRERADAPARAPGPVAALGPLGVQEGEPGGPDGAGGVGAGEGCGLLLRGVAGLLGPGAVAAAVLLEPGGGPGRSGSAQVGGRGAGWR